MEIFSHIQRWTLTWLTPAHTPPAPSPLPGGSEANLTVQLLIVRVSVRMVEQQGIFKNTAVVPSALDVTMLPVSQEVQALSLSLWRSRFPPQASSVPAARHLSGSGCHSPTRRGRQEAFHRRRECQRFPLGPAGPTAPPPPTPGCLWKGSCSHHGHVARLSSCEAQRLLSCS